MSKKYTPTQFSPKIYPEWGELYSILSAVQMRELLFAITKYPNYIPSDCPIWPFVKSQIDKDYQNFMGIKEERSEIIKNYWGNKTEQKLSSDDDGGTKGNKSSPNDPDGEQKLTITTNDELLTTNNKHKLEKINQKSFGEHAAKNKSKKILFDEIESDDWEKLFEYWTQEKSGTKYTQEGREYAFGKLKELSDNDFYVASCAVQHAAAQKYQGFFGSQGLFYDVRKKSLSQTQRPQKGATSDEIQAFLDDVNGVAA